MSTKMKARAIRAWLSETKTGKECAKVELALSDGRVMEWMGFFTTDNAVERTLNTLKTCGWSGEDIGDLNTVDGSREVEVVIEPEEYNGNTYDRVKWINPLAVTLTGPRLNALRERVKSVKSGALPPEPPPAELPPIEERVERVESAVENLQQQLADADLPF